MKILICCFLIVIYSAKSNDDEIAIYDFVLDDMVIIYSIDSIILINELSYFCQIPDSSYRDVVYKKISEKGDKILSESAQIENFASLLNNPSIKHRISQIELDTCFLDSNARIYERWEKFHGKYPGNSEIISFSPIIYTKKNSIVYIYTTIFREGRGRAVLYKLKRIKKRWIVVDRHNMWFSH